MTFACYQTVDPYISLEASTASKHLNCIIKVISNKAITGGTRFMMVNIYIAISAYLFGVIYLSITRASCSIIEYGKLHSC